MIGKRQSSLSKSVLGLNGAKLRMSSHRNILIQFAEELLMAAKPAHSWAGVRFSSFSFPYLLTKTAWVCSWPPDYPVFVYAAAFLFNTQQDYPIPCIHLLCCHRKHFQRTVKPLPACQQFLVFVKCQGLKPRKESSLPLGRYFCQAVVLSSPCLGPFPLDGI